MPEEFERHPQADIEHDWEAESKEEDVEVIEQMDDIDREVDRLTKEIHDAAAKSDRAALEKAQAALRAVLDEERKEFAASRGESRVLEGIEDRVAEKQAERPIRMHEGRESAPEEEDYAEDLFAARMFLKGQEALRLREEGNQEAADRARAEFEKIQEELRRYDEGEAVGDMNFLEKLISTEMRRLVSEREEYSSEGDTGRAERTQKMLLALREVQDNIADGVNPPWTEAIRPSTIDRAYEGAPTELKELPPEEKAA